jgi:hypothetical protein
MNVVALVVQVEMEDSTDPRVEGKVNGTHERLGCAKPWSGGGGWVGQRRSWR